jgi:hypothetical protein
MRAAEIILVPPISGAANAATAIANAATAFPGTLRQFAPPAGKKCSRHDSCHAPDILPRAGHNTGGHPMPLCPPLAPLSAAVQQASRTTTAQPGWAGPGKDRSGPWLRNAAAGLCVLAAAAAAVSFTASGDVGYRNCLNAPQVWVGRVSAGG